MGAGDDGICCLPPSTSTTSHQALRALSYLRRTLIAVHRTPSLEDRAVIKALSCI